MYLPTVKKEVGCSIGHYLNKYDKMGDEDAVSEELRIIAEENPVVAAAISKWANNDRKKTPLGVAMCGIIVYRLLRSQAEADHMSEILA